MYQEEPEFCAESGHKHARTGELPRFRRATLNRDTLRATTRVRPTFVVSPEHLRRSRAIAGPPPAPWLMIAESAVVVHELVQVPVATSSHNRGAALPTQDRHFRLEPILMQNGQLHRKATQPAIRVRDRPLRCTDAIRKGNSFEIGRPKYFRGLGGSSSMRGTPVQPRSRDLLLRP